MKVGDDLRQCRPDDGLVERREEQSKKYRGDDLGTGARVHPRGHSCGNGLRHTGRSPVMGIW